MKLQTYEAFYNAMNRGVEAFHEAGGILVKLIEADPDTVEKMLEANPALTADTLDMFERIGRKQIYYHLAINERPGTLALRRCPYSEQVKYFTAQLDLLLLNGDVLKVSIHSITKSQADQIFARGRVRTLAEQRAYLESKKSKPQPLDVNTPYTIRGGKIIFYQSFTADIATMANLLAEMSR